MQVCEVQLLGDRLQGGMGPHAPWPSHSHPRGPSHYSRHQVHHRHLRRPVVTALINTHGGRLCWWSGGLLLVPLRPKLCQDLEPRFSRLEAVLWQSLKESLASLQFTNIILSH